MIRVHKSKNVPASLLADNCVKYDGQDVQEMLVNDQHENATYANRRQLKVFK